MLVCTAWDFRRTLADMWADHHYGTMADLLRQHGIGIYSEAVYLDFLETQFNPAAVR